VEDNRVMPGEDDDMEDDRVTPGEDDDVEGDEEEALGSDASALPSVYLRGTVSLPRGRYLLIGALRLHP
jgi:hypothetical protein